MKGGVDLNFRGRTVAFIVVITMLFSSLGTAFLVGNSGLIDRFIGSEAILSRGFSPQGTGDFDSYTDKLKKAYSLIKSNYVHKVDGQQLIDGAIQGMIHALNDPYSTYMDPKIASQFKQDLKSSFTGIGAEIALKNGQFIVISPLKGSPAEKAGIRSGDQVLKANGESLEGLDATEAVGKIRGPKGTKVKLEIIRPGVKDLLHIVVIRDEISLRTVEAHMFPGQVGRLTVTQFSEKTAEDFAKELASLEKQGMKGLMIDVRGNPGGLLPVVLEMCEQFVPQNKVMMVTEDKGGVRQRYISAAKQTKSYPIVVLIDKGSASASEILAAALKEAGGYSLIGETTFGKGTVQSTEELGDGSNIKLTVAKWLTPTGNWIDQHGGTKGIKPDISVKMPDYFQAIPPQAEKSIQVDAYSAEVKNMQMVLEALGFNPGREDGYFDQRTELALKAFQRTKKLSMSGQLNTETSNKMREAFMELLRDPSSDMQLQVALQVLKKKIK
jgi:carboxyl-terminal processing protease